MVAPALLAGGNMGTGVASLNLICEGIEEGVVKRRGGVGSTVTQPLLVSPQAWEGA